MTITQAGVFTQDTATRLFVGSLNQNGTGTNVIGDDITSDQADGITFSELVTLTSTIDDDTIVFDSSTNNGNITFDDVTADGAGVSIDNADNENIRLVAGLADITVDGEINLGAGVGTGDITITSGDQVTFNNTVLAENFDQQASTGTGLTIFNDNAVFNIDGDFSFTGNNLTITANGTSDVLNAMTVTQAGTYTQVTDSLLTVGSFLQDGAGTNVIGDCLLYTSPSPRDLSTSRMPSSA